jgi:hypothetical protein
MTTLHSEPSVDDEWNMFLMSQNTNQTSITNINKCTIKSALCDLDNITPSSLIPSNCEPSLQVAPPCEDLNISTKTKVLFLNTEIDINTVFWKIPIIEYCTPSSGVIKKQMKIVSKTEEEYQDYCKKLVDIPYYNENIIKQINNPNARRIKFKDERKITIGISKKDIMNYRGKVKNAFYNCFAMIIRFQHEGLFREIHVKVFNTGKMEIPGILNATLLEIIKVMVLQILQPFFETIQLEYVENLKYENVLINSNFNCGFYINREKLHYILSKKYNIESSFDPCNYPGVKCKYYYNNDISSEDPNQNGNIDAEDCHMKMSELGESKKYTEVSFMIFRTGSCLILGNCSERILLFIFEFLKGLLIREYPNISVSNNETNEKNKKPKLRKKIVFVSHEYYNSVITAN